MIEYLYAGLDWGTTVMPKKILIIEDEKPIVEILTYGLSKEGFEAISSHTAAMGIQKAKEEKPDLILLDWMLPDMNGPDVCQMLCEKSNIPIIMLTAKAHIEDKLYGLQVGAEDYITKPFDLREVIARIKTVLRRRNKSQINSPEELLEFDGEISIEERTVKKNDQLIELTAKEFDLLLFFVKHPRQVFTREVLLEKLWDCSFLGDSRTIDIHIQRIRKKLNMEQQLITVFGVGYKYVPGKE